MPSERLMVPSMFDLASPLAVGCPDEVRGGHAAAHAPVHDDVDAVSDWNRYSVLPELSVRNVPFGPLCVSTMPEPLVVPVFEPLDEPAELLLPELPQAAANTATIASGAPTRTVHQNFRLDSMRFMIILLPTPTKGLLIGGQCG